VGEGGDPSPGSERADIRDYKTLDSIEADVRTTVLPDDDNTEDEHPCFRQIMSYRLSTLRLTEIAESP